MNRRITKLACCLVASVALTAAPPKKNDFNADGKSDIVLQSSGTAAVMQLQMFNNSINASNWVYGPQSVNWVVAASGDVNKDGRSDLFWQNRLTGEVFLMYMNGLSPVFAPTAALDASGAAITIPASKKIYTEQDPNWQIVLSADFDRDGQTDLVWQNVKDGRVYVMFLNADGTIKATSKYITTEANTNWQIVAAGNFSGLGGNDLVWQFRGTGDPRTGQVYLMGINADGTVNAAKSKLLCTQPDLNWKLVAADDFNADGAPDLLWWNSASSEAYVQLYDASQNLITTDTGVGTSGRLAAAVATSTLMGTTNWVPVATGDFNGDGYADILWRNTVGGELYVTYFSSVAKGTINLADSGVVLNNTLTNQDLHFNVVAGNSSTRISQVNLTATTSNPFALDGSNPPLSLPPTYTTLGDTVNFNSDVAGALNSNTINWSAWKTDGSAQLSVPGTPGGGITFGAATNGSTAANAASFATASPALDFILKGVSAADPSRVTARRFITVAAPGVTSLVATPSIINAGGTSTLAFTFPAGQSGVLTCDADPTVSQTFTASGSYVATPPATGTYKLTVTNPAGKSNFSTAVVTVNNVNPALNCAITVNSPAANLTANSVYTASVPAFAAGVTGTYAWTITGGTITGSTTGSTVSFTTNGSGTVTLNMQKTVGTGTNTGTTGALTIVAAPAAATTMTVKNDAAATQATYLTASRALQTAAITAHAGMTYLWTATNATLVDAAGVTTGAGPYVNTVTFTPAASGVVTLSVVEINAALTQSAPYSEQRTIVAAPNATVTLPTGFVTPGVASNGAASVPAVANTTYLWNLAPQSGTAVATNSTGTTPSLTYTSAGGPTAGNTVSLTCTVTNGAGLAATTNPAVTQIICAPPSSALTAPTAAAANVTVGFNSTATATNFTAAGTHSYDVFTYLWTLTNATIVGNATGTTITYTPTGTGPVTIKVQEVNAAGLAGTASPITTVTAVAAPVISSFTVTNSTITAGDAAIFNYSFTGGTASLVDTTVANTPAAAVPLTGIPSTQTTSSWSLLLANVSTAKHTISLRVTNAASDFVQSTVTVDVAALPVVTGVVAFEIPNAAYGTTYAGSVGVPYPFGTALNLVPTYTATTTPTFEGQTVAINPGNVVVNPLTGSTNVVTPAQLQTVYSLSVTNRAGRTVTGLTTATVNMAAVAVPSIVGGDTATTAAAGLTYALPSAATLIPAATATNRAVTYAIVAGGTCVNASVTGSTVTFGTGAAAGQTIQVQATSVVDPSKKSAVLVITLS